MVSKLLTFKTGPLNPWIIESMHGLNQSMKQARRPEFCKYTRLQDNLLGNQYNKWPFW